MFCQLIDTSVYSIIPAMVLAEIENKTSLPTADNFDLIAGTSAGGMLALGLSARDDNGRPRYKASELVDFCKNWNNEIFNPSPQHTQPVQGNLIPSVEDSLAGGEKLSHSLERVIGDYFRDTTLGDVLEVTKTMVAYYDVETSAPFFLKSWEPEHTTVNMIQAAWGTSAASTDFKPFEFFIGSKTRTLFDGGVFINSPVVSAYEEAKRIISEERNFNHFKDTDIFILSFGVDKLIPEIISEKMEDLSFLGDNYVRLYPPLSKVGIYIDNASKDKSTDIGDLAYELIKSAGFNRVCDHLMLTT